MDRGAWQAQRESGTTEQLSVGNVDMQPNLAL